MLHDVKTDLDEQAAYSDGENPGLLGAEVYRATWDGSAPFVTVVLGEPGPVEIPFLGWPQVGETG